MKRTKYNASSMIELILFCLLLSLFAVTTFFLIYGGSQSFQKIHQRQTDLLDLRIASNYIDQKIKQNDARDAFSIEYSPQLGNLLKITEPAIEGDNHTYVTYIYAYNGNFKEIYTIDGYDLNDQVSMEICQLDQIEYQWDKSNLRVKLEKIENGKTYQSDITIPIKTKQKGQSQSS